MRTCHVARRPVCIRRNHNLVAVALGMVAVRSDIERAGENHQRAER